MGTFAKTFAKQYMKYQLTKNPMVSRERMLMADKRLGLERIGRMLGEGESDNVAEGAFDQDF